MLFTAAAWPVLSLAPESIWITTRLITYMLSPACKKGRPEKKVGHYA
ncbi:hypothetical protein JNO12_15120 [Erwinia aphidicola]|nr:hypothetical protein [Erwinia aphidicola]